MEEGFCESMLKRSYAVVTLPRAATSAAKALLESDSVFEDVVLQSSSSSLASFSSGTADDSYRGAFRNEHRAVLFMRPTADGRATPRGASRALPSAAPLCRALHSLGLRLLDELAAALDARDPTFLSNLADQTPAERDDDETNAARDGPELASILSIFHYTPACSSELPSCPEHVDYTLLTIIPFATEPGLEVLDISTCEWRCPEREEGTTHKSEHYSRAVVLVGEALEFVARCRLTATTHRVLLLPQKTPRPRRSCPYLLHARHDAPLRRLQPDGSAEAATNAILAADFVRSSQSTRISAVYSG